MPLCYFVACPARKLTEPCCWNAAELCSRCLHCDRHKNDMFRALLSLQAVRAPATQTDVGIACHFVPQTRGLCGISLGSQTRPCANLNPQRSPEFSKCLAYLGRSPVRAYESASTGSGLYLASRKAASLCEIGL